MPCSRAASETLRKGTWRAPGRVSGEWISSLSTQAPCSAAQAASAFSCASVGSVPVGLWGLQRMIATAPARNSASIPSTSISPSTSGTSASSQPSSSITAKKGW